MGFFDKLKKITTNLFSGFTEADETFFEELEEADVLYGVTMQEQGVSKMLTINLNDMDKELKLK